MVRAIYLNGYTNDISACIDVRKAVYDKEYGEDAGRDDRDRDAVHILLFELQFRNMLYIEQML